MPIRRVRAAEAFATLKANPDRDWPDVDDPYNRFAQFADPRFRPRFKLEPGQRIFTIGSCFARHVEATLARRGFDIPALSFRLDEKVWGADQAQMLNNYVPPAIAPQIRWAFGMDSYEVTKHAVEVKPGRFVDLHMHTPGGLALPAEAVLDRREKVNAIYRRLADCSVVIVTLGLIEAWFDARHGLYICGAPRKIATWREPERFEMHVLGYDDVVASLRELASLFDAVCPPGYRMILTVSPVPLGATFTDADVAVANAYSKSVLRAATEEFVAGRENVEYFPSYESVTLTDRSLAYERDQMHVTDQMVKFNVDRMIAKYVNSPDAETPASILKEAQEEIRARRESVAFKRLQEGVRKHPDDPKLCVALAAENMKAGRAAVAEKMLLDLLAAREDVFARATLARLYNSQGRYEEAVPHAEKASEHSGLRMYSSMERVEAYYHLGRYAEGLALAGKILFAQHRGKTIAFWKARFHEKLGDAPKAEELFRACNEKGRVLEHMVAFASFLGAQGRWDEALGWIDDALETSPLNAEALRLRAEARKHGAVRRPMAGSAAPARPSRLREAGWWLSAAIGGAASLWRRGDASAARPRD